MRRLIVTGDDFGLAVPVNDAILEAHRRGILTAASLMVSGGAANDAVEKARSCASLRVGLHLVVVEGRSVLPPGEIPDLVDAGGEFSSDLVRTGFKYFFSIAARRQLEKEIRAQFEAFLETGLALDHVNAHNHMHVHPTVFSLMLEAGRAYGLRCIRLPYEPPVVSWRASGRSLPAKTARAAFLSPWLRLMKLRIRGAGLRCNDRIFGMDDSGAMTAELVLRFMRLLPEGCTEMYFHPSTRRCPEIDRTMPEYQHENELAALTSREVIEAIDRLGIKRIAFSNLAN